MADVRNLDGSSYDMDGTVRVARNRGVTKGVLIGFDEDGGLLFSGFGSVTNAEVVFMMEAVKLSILQEAK